MSTDHKDNNAISRRSFLKTTVTASAALPLFGILSRPANAAEFNYKMATGQDPTHPVNIRAQEALNRIREATNGRLHIKLFPQNMLGSDTDLLAQVRSGAIEFFNQSSSVLATFVPAAGIVNTGFVFQNYNDVWRALDGDLGSYIRSEITKRKVVSVCKAWDNGFRHVSTSNRPIKSAADLKGLKIRVPQAPILTSLFQALASGPAPINFNELYSSLQTKVVEGQENPLPIISTAKLYEVQKYISMTGHVWDGYWILGNRHAWTNLPEDIRTIVENEFNRSAMDERADIARLSLSLRQDMEKKGVTFVDPDLASFRENLKKTTFYADWKTKFGPEAWGLLEKYVGKLV